MTLSSYLPKKLLQNVLKMMYVKALIRAVGFYHGSFVSLWLMPCLLIILFFYKTLHHSSLEHSSLNTYYGSLLV